MGEAKQRKLLAEKHTRENPGEENPGGRIEKNSGELAAITRQLRRRLDSGEPIKDTRNWFLKQKKVWESYFADLDPLLQWFVLDMTTEFRIWLEQKESPDRPLTEIVLEKVADLRQYHADLAEPIIDRLMKLIESVPGRAPVLGAAGA
jgi:hypothetical protein